MWVQLSLASNFNSHLSASAPGPLGLSTSRSLKVKGFELPQIQKKKSVPKYTAHCQLELYYISRSKHWDEENHGWVSLCVIHYMNKKNNSSEYKTFAHRCKASLTLFITVAITIFKWSARTNNKNKVNKTYQDKNAPSWSNILRWEETVPTWQNNSALQLCLKRITLVYHRPIQKSRTN